MRLASSPAARTEAADDFLRGVHPPPSAATRSRMEAALEGLSDDQLHRLRDGGVRCWPQEHGLPPDILETGAAAPSAASAAGYVPGARTLRYSPDMSTAAWRHELGHALDDVGGETRSMRLDELALPARRRAVRTLAREEHSGRTFDSTHDRALGAAFDRYRDHLDVADGRADGRTTQDTRERLSFDLGAREGYSLRSVEEFYAEGFSAFHGSAERTERMARNAPELYQRLAEDARAAGTLPSWVDPTTLTVR